MFQHPLVDYVDRGCAAVESRAEIVYFSEAFADLLTSVAQQGLTPVVVTRPDARLTFAAQYYLEAAEGLWAIRTDEGLVDRRDDAVYPSVGELAARSGTRSVSSRPVAAVPDAMQLYFSLSVQHSASEDTMLGEAAEILAGPSDARLTGWGSHEPAMVRWDRARFTAAVRQAMPGASRFVLAGSNGAFQAVASIRRTRVGVEETIVGVTSAGDATAGLREVATRAKQTLSDIAEATALPLIAMMSASPGRSDLMTERTPVLAPVPIAALIGPRALRNLTADPAALIQQFAASVVGRKRIPSVLVDFVAAGGAPWLEAQRFAESLGAPNIEAALKVDDASPTLGGGR